MGTWYAATKLRALYIWDYIDPSREEPLELRKPMPADATKRDIYPEPAQAAPDVEPADIPIPEPLSREQIEEEDLTEIERDRLKRLEKEYERVRKELGDFIMYLFNTVESDYMILATRGDSAYDMMVILKEALAPSKKERECQLRAQLKSLAPSEKERKYRIRAQLEFLEKYGTLSGVGRGR